MDHHMCLGWEVKIDISGQSNDCLRVCNVKMKKKLPGWKQGTFLRMYRLQDHSIKWFELIFSKMLKLDEKESLNPKMSDFKWFSEVFNFSMLNMFLWFYHIFLISEIYNCLILMFEYSFWTLGLLLQESEVILPLVSL